MVNFYPPSRLFQRRSLYLLHSKVNGRLVFRVPFLGDRPEHFDEPKAFPMHHPSFRRNVHLPDGHISLSYPG